MGAGATFASSQIAPGLTLHLNSDARRKTNLVNIFWVGPLDSAVTARAVFPNCLMRGTQRFPSLKELTKETERLFGVSIGTDTRKIGERHVIQFRLEFVNDKFLPGSESVLAEAIQFFRELFTDPHLVDGRFDAEVTAQEKETHRRLIEGLLNDKRSYAVQRCIEETCSDEEFRRHEQGTVEDLERLTAAELTDQWRQNLQTAEMHVYFSGDLTLEESQDALKPLLSVTDRTPVELPPLPAPKLATEPREVIERMSLQQAKLVLSYRTGVSFTDARVPGLVVGNGILGSFPHSKLFVNVREGASLCYYAGSFLERTHGMMFISSGIDQARYHEARDLIGVQVSDVAAGNFSDEDLEATKLALDGRLRMIEDSPSTLMDIHLAWHVNGAEYDLKRYRDQLNAVTREDVIESFANVRGDVVYLLAPEEEN